MIYIKTPEQIEILREGGKRHAAILEILTAKVVPGVTTGELDALALSLVREGGDEPAFLGYKPAGASYAYPATLCVSVNDEVVHGIPDAKRVLQEGDVVSLDLGLKHKGLFTDAAVTVTVGTVDVKKRELLKVAQASLYKGIDEIKPGARTGDIGHAIEHYIKAYKYGIVRDLAGHGVGIAIHEDPFIPNYGQKGKGTLLKAGMVIAIEPMVNLGTAEVTLDDDDYTFRTADGKASAHFEHTVLVTEDGYEILTQ
jgi:methionyl aminopeptidase